LCDAWAEALITSNSIAFTQTLIWRGWVFPVNIKLMISWILLKFMVLEILS